MLALSAFSPSGTKRMKSVERSSRALLLATAPTLSHEAPPSSEYCQVPLPDDRVVMAMPSAAPLSTSDTEPPSKAATC